MRNLSDSKVRSFLSALSNLPKGKHSAIISPSKSPYNESPAALRSSPAALYPSLMKSLALSNRPDLSLLLFLTHPSNSTPSPHLLNSFLQSLHLLNQPQLILPSLFSLFPFFQIAPSQTSFTILLNSSNSLDLVYEAFYQIKNPDSVAFGSLIKILCKAGEMEEARGVLDVMLKRGIKPSLQTCTCILRGYCVQRRIKDADRFLQKMENEIQDFPNPDVVTYTVFIEGLCLIGDFDSVEKVLKETERDNSKWQPNSVTYNVYISGLFKAGFYTNAFHQTLVMHEKGLKPTLQTISILFKCLCSDPSTAFKASKLLQMSEQLNWEVDSFVYNTLMGRFLAINQPVRVLKPFTDMFKKGVNPDTCSFTIFMRALCRVKKIHLAKIIITSTDFKADVIAYNTLLHELYKEGELREINLIYMYMIGRNIVPNNFTLGIMIDCLCRERKFIKAMDFIINLCKDKYLSNMDLVLRFIKWLVIFGQLGVVRQLFDEMPNRDFGLKVVLFDILIKELCKKGYCKRDFYEISPVLDYMVRMTRK